MKKVLSLFVSILMATTLIASCSQPSVNAPAGDGSEDAKKTLIVGLESGFAPLEFLGDDGSVIGVDPDIAAEIAKSMDVELQIEDMNFDSLISALDAGRIDLIASGMSITEDRARMVDFSVPYYSAKQVVVVQESNSDIKTPDDLVNKKIAVQESTTGDFEASEIDGVEMDRFKRYADAIMSLKTGRVDAVVMDSAPAQAFVANNPDLKILEQELVTEEYAMAVKKGNQDILKAVNDTIISLKGSGELERIKAKYEQ